MSVTPEGTGQPPPQGPGPTPLQQNFRKASEQTRQKSPFMFAVIGLCFFLPFISISCSGQRLATMSGVQLVTGAEVEVDEEALTEDLEEAFGIPASEQDTPDEFPTESQENDPSIWAIIALAGAVLGVIVGFVTRGRSRSIASLVAAVLGLGALIGLRFDLQGDVKEGGGLVTVEYRFGYWIAALLFVALAIAHGLYLRTGRARTTFSAEPTGPPP